MPNCTTGRWQISRPAAEGTCQPGTNLLLSWVEISAGCRTGGPARRAARAGAAAPPLLQTLPHVKMYCLLPRRLLCHNSG